MFTSQNNFEYVKAREIALSMESIQSSSSETVHKVSEEMSSSYNKCFHCGRTNQKAPQCQFKDAVCRKCNKTGNLPKVCQSKKDPASSSPVSINQLSTDVVSVQLSSPEEKQEYSLFNIQDTKGIKEKTDTLYEWQTSFNGD